MWAAVAAFGALEKTSREGDTRPIVPKWAFGLLAVAGVLALVPAAAGHSTDDQRFCCVNVITSASYDAASKTLAVTWVSPARKLCPFGVFVDANKPTGVNDGSRYSYILGGCKVTSWQGSAERFHNGSFQVTGDFYVTLVFGCQAKFGEKVTARDCLGLEVGQPMGSMPVKVKVAGTTTTPSQSKPTLIGIDQSATVQCGTGSGATSVRFLNDPGSKPYASIDTRSSVDLPVILGGGAGAPVTWSLTRAAVPGWPVPPPGSDFGKLSVTGCGAKYVAPSSTGSSPRMFVEIRAKVPSAGCTSGSPGEGGPCFVVGPASAQITIRGGDVGPPGGSFCGKEYLQVAVSRSSHFYLGDGYRNYGPYPRARTFQPIATGWWRVNIYYDDGSGENEDVDIRVPPCGYAKVIRG